MTALDWFLCACLTISTASLAYTLITLMRVTQQLNRSTAAVITLSEQNVKLRRGR